VIASGRSGRRPDACRDVAYVHDSTASRAVRTVGAGVPACLTVTLLDGIVPGRWDEVRPPSAQELTARAGGGRRAALAPDAC